MKESTFRRYTSKSYLMREYDFKDDRWLHGLRWYLKYQWQIGMIKSKMDIDKICLKYRSYCTEVAFYEMVCE